MLVPHLTRLSSTRNFHPAIGKGLRDWPISRGWVDRGPLLNEVLLVVNCWNVNGASARRYMLVRKLSRTRLARHRNPAVWKWLGIARRGAVRQKLWEDPRGSSCLRSLQRAFVTAYWFKPIVLPGSISPRISRRCNAFLVFST